ncbi:uncharacterized protein LTR77_010201 [Saxophila tyrrhenica]|uniref:BTB domain-containing protein n=1 Tax=Saxophila tyrrhenica TaxID=1690608 RepID=A0AAV9NZY2_9PEZI|nr:hypothetical protein LTR77_010201 [Saxophila tyrrhenica]
MPNACIPASGASRSRSSATTAASSTSPESDYPEHQPCEAVDEHDPSSAKAETEPETDIRRISLHVEATSRQRIKIPAKPPTLAGTQASILASRRGAVSREPLYYDIDGKTMTDKGWLSPVGSKASTPPTVNPEVREKLERAGPHQCFTVGRGCGCLEAVERADEQLDTLEASLQPRGEGIEGSAHPPSAAVSPLRLGHVPALLGPVSGCSDEASPIDSGGRADAIDSSVWPRPSVREHGIPATSERQVSTNDKDLGIADLLFHDGASADGDRQRRPNTERTYSESTRAPNSCSSEPSSSPGSNRPEENLSHGSSDVDRLQHTLKLLWQNPLYTDLKITTGNYDFFLVHRCIMAAQSPHLSHLVKDHAVPASSSGGQAGHVLDLTPADPDALGSILRYLYTGLLIVPTYAETTLSGPDLASLAILLPIIELTMEYQLRDLLREAKNQYCWTTCAWPTGHPLLLAEAFVATFKEERLWEMQQATLGCTLAFAEELVSDQDVYDLLLGAGEPLKVLVVGMSKRMLRVEDDVDVSPCVMSRGDRKRAARAERAARLVATCRFGHLRRV